VPELGSWAVLIVGALVASIIGGVAGFGAGVVMLPLVAWVVGFKAAVPVLTVTMFVGNLSRLWWSRREVDVSVVVAFLAGAVPATALGAALYAGATAESLGRAIGFFSRRSRCAASSPQGGCASASSTFRSWAGPSDSCPPSW